MDLLEGLNPDGHLLVSVSAGLGLDPPDVQVIGLRSAEAFLNVMIKGALKSLALRLRTTERELNGCPLWPENPPRSPAGP